MNYFYNHETVVKPRLSHLFHASRLSHWVSQILFNFQAAAVQKIAEILNRKNFGT